VTISSFKATYSKNTVTDKLYLLSQNVYESSDNGQTFTLHASTVAADPIVQMTFNADVTNQLFVGLTSNSDIIYANGAALTWTT
jgi:hypothetical protein